MSDEKLNYIDLLTSTRVIGCIQPGDFIGTNSSGDIYCRYSSNWWNTLSDIVRLETWECTHEALKKIYCFGLPEYIKHVDHLENGRSFAIDDLKNLCKNSLKGLNNLKNTYNIAYQTKTGGKYDDIFDTLINSYAKKHIKSVKDLCIDKDIKTTSFNIDMPKLTRQVGFSTKNTSEDDIKTNSFNNDSDSESE